MKKLLAAKRLIALLMVLVIALSFAACNKTDTEEPDDGSNDSEQTVTVDKTALKAEIANAVTKEGDYTADSFNAYVVKLAEAKAIVKKADATQQEVDGITAALTEARLALKIKNVEAVSGAEKNIELSSGESLEIAIADYVNVNALSKITYGVKSNSESLTAGDIKDGKFTLTAGNVKKAETATVRITVYYDGEEKLAVELSVKLIEKESPKPTLIVKDVVKSYDIYLLENKTNIVIDFSENVNNEDDLILTYSVKYGNETLTLDGTSYTFTFGEYDDKVKNEEFTVTVSYTVDGEEKSISYTYKLGLSDSTDSRLPNGDFEEGLLGWTVVGNIGNVTSDKNYWLDDPENAEGYAFGMDGEKMFSAYAVGAYERAVGTLTSSAFKVGGSGFVTFKLGAMKDGNYVYVDVVDAETKEILARYYNGLWQERTNDVKSGCTLIAYKADLSEFMGKEVFFRISDNADSGYGLFFADSFTTYYASEPEGFNAATPVNYTVSGTIYDLFNGGFELGDVQGWWNIGEPGAVTGSDGFFKENVPYGKDGNYLYSGVENFDELGVMREGNTGSLTSSVFELGGSGYITYMLGGGNDYCYVEVIDSTTGEILARYRQQAREDAVLKTYVADLTAYIGRSVRIRLVDNATYDWGCVSFDNVKTYYASKPEGIDAADVKEERYSIANGSFEAGSNGWTMSIKDKGEHNTLGWVQSEEIDATWYTKNDGRKDGNNLFTFVTPANINCEKTTGTLTSSSFVLKKDAFVAFRFGGAGTREVYLQLCRADGTVIATFYNEAEGKVDTEMYAYFYQYTGDETECFFRVVDNSTSNYGCFVVDDFRVNLEEAPDGFIPAIQPTEE
ncbi:MAG: FIVAR domain-containing protein [Clostridia bacterium]|nr:FIVAR domain-containing protein [Clostridia bacterium]